MERKVVKYRVKGFTIAELLVSLALTSIAITLSYSTLSYIQKLFYGYKEQNLFLTQFTDLKNRLDHESLKAQTITEINEKEYLIKRDSVEIRMKLEEKMILMEMKDRRDTFKIATKRVQREFEPMKNPLWSNKLVKSFQLETEYTKQKFNLYFYKDYDASVKLELEKE